MKGGGWKGSLSIACSVPQASQCRHTAGGLHRATALKKPILKQSQRQTLTLETGTCLLTPGCSPPVLWGGGGGGGCMFEAVCQPVLITSEPTRGQKVCSLSATSEAACMHTHSFFAVSRRKEKARAQSTWTQRPSALINYRESGAIDVRITFRSVTASSFSSVVSCILIPGQTDWRRGSGWRVTAQ